MNTDPSIYNTITNPMNGYNRNPYLNKVVSNAVRYNASNRDSIQDLRASNVLSSAA